MISYEHSQHLLHSMALKNPWKQTEKLDLENSLGRILAEDIYARENLPQFDNSAMDGFALNYEAAKVYFNSSDPWIPVSSLVGAGDLPPPNLSLKSAVEIMTGAPLPNSHFDSVIKIEDVEIKIGENSQKFIRLKEPPTFGSHTRKMGEDTRFGSLLLQNGILINPHHLLILAAQGITQLLVKSQISVGLLSTGKEIVNHNTSKLGPGQIRNSTGVYLQSIFSTPLYKVNNCGIVPDDPDTYLEKIKSLMEEGTDLLISTGAVSMGVFDFVKPALESLGAQIHFHKCAIRPGKPILFASLFYKKKTSYIFGIPGNPVSTVVGYNFFIKTFVYHWLKLNTPQPLFAKLSTDVKKPEGLKCFYKANLFEEDGKPMVETLNGQASFMVSPLAHANAWAILPEKGDHLKKGTQVEVLSL